MDIKIIYEDENIIVLDKPSGLPTHPANEKDERETLVSFLVLCYPLIKNVGENPLRPGVVHRLDKETSGLMVVAKNNETFFELKKQFQKREVEKKYIALVSGTLEKDKGTIEIPLSKNGPRSYAYAKQGQTLLAGSDPALPKTALTKYKVMERYTNYTLVEVIPKTGRQHQIRVHFASINHPVACDKLYGRKSKKCPSGLKRHFLHSSYLKFWIKNVLMEFESKLPEDLSEAIKTLEA